MSIFVVINLLVMERNYEKLLAWILVGGNTVAPTCYSINPKHELPEKEPHSEQLIQSDKLDLSGISYAASGIGVRFLYK
jgi:hypothetical protein